MGACGNGGPVRRRASAAASRASSIAPVRNHVPVGGSGRDMIRSSVNAASAGGSMNWQLFTAFLLITLVLFLIPGPIVTLVIATSVSKGLRAGFVTVAGTSCGTAVLLAVIALGLGWILNHALYWFEMLRWAGALYLIWLGIQAWRGAGATAPLPPSDRVQFGRGFLV